MNSGQEKATKACLCKGFAIFSYQEFTKPLYIQALVAFSYPEFTKPLQIPAFLAFLLFYKLFHLENKLFQLFKLILATMDEMLAWLEPVDARTHMAPTSSQRKQNSDGFEMLSHEFSHMPCTSQGQP